jgi:transketolase
MSTRDAFGEELSLLADEYPNIMYVAADTLKSMGGSSIHKKYPDRAINVGIAEQNMALIGAGMASEKAKVFIATYATFASMRICEQIRTFIAYPKLDVKIIAGLGGLSGDIEGVTHQGTEDMGIMRCIPGMTVIAAADAASTRKITRAIAEYDGPVYMRIGRGPSPLIFDECYNFKIGKANVLVEEGSDAAIFCYGTSVAPCLESQKLLKEAGYGVRLIEMPCIKPIDKEIIHQTANECKLLVAVEDHNIIGGLGSAITEVVCEEKPTIVKRIGLSDVFAQSGSLSELLDFYGINANKIFEAIKKAIEAL